MSLKLDEFIDPREKRREYNRIWYHNHKKNFFEYRNRPEVKARRKIYIQNYYQRPEVKERNLQRCREQRQNINYITNYNIWRRKWRFENRSKAFQIIVGEGNPIRCMSSRCNETDLDLLIKDHIFGGGNKHRKQMGNGFVNNGATKIDRWIIKHPDEARKTLQLLCVRCHRKKHSHR